MMRQLIGGAVAVVVIGSIGACTGGNSSQVTTPTSATSVAVAPPAAAGNVAVEGFLGDWQADPITDPAVIAAAEATASQSCSQVEFHALRHPDSRMANVIFAATCARIRIRVEGTGTMTGEALVWKAQGSVTTPGGATCAARFVEGNRAQQTVDGPIKVTYNGTVCGNPVAGTALVRKR